MKKYFIIPLIICIMFCASSCGLVLDDDNHNPVILSSTITGESISVSFGDYEGSNLLNDSNDTNNFSTIYYLTECGITVIIGFENTECHSYLIDNLDEINGYEIKSFVVPGTEHIVIPNIVDGAIISAIDGGAFENCTSIKSITIPSSITLIEPGAFDGCSSNLVIYGGAQSEAHTFALENGIYFELFE